MPFAQTLDLTFCKGANSMAGVGLLKQPAH